MARARDPKGGQGNGPQVVEPRSRQVGRGELREVSQREELPAGDHGAGLPARGPRRRGRDPRGRASRAPEHPATAQRARLVPRRGRDLTGSCSRRIKNGIDQSLEALLTEFGAVASRTASFGFDARRVSAAYFAVNFIVAIFIVTKLVPSGARSSPPV